MVTNNISTEAIKNISGLDDAPRNNFHAINKFFAGLATFSYLHIDDYLRLHPKELLPLRNSRRGSKRDGMKKEYQNVPTAKDIAYRRTIWSAKLSYTKMG